MGVPEDSSELAVPTELGPKLLTEELLYGGERLDDPAETEL